MKQLIKIKLPNYLVEECKVRFGKNAVASRAVTQFLETEINENLDTFVLREKTALALMLGDKKFSLGACLVMPAKMNNEFKKVSKNTGFSRDVEISFRLQRALRNQIYCKNEIGGESI